MPPVEQKLPTLPEHLSSPLVFSVVRVNRSLVLCVCFVDRCFSLFFWPLCVCPSSIYGFWLPLWYLRYTDSDYPFGIFKLFLTSKLLIKPLFFVISMYPHIFTLVGHPLTDLTLPQLCACPKPGHGFQMPYVMFFFICT